MKLIDTLTHRTYGTAHLSTDGNVWTIETPAHTIEGDESYIRLCWRGMALTARRNGARRND